MQINMKIALAYARIRKQFDCVIVLSWKSATRPAIRRPIHSVFMLDWSYLPENSKDFQQPTDENLKFQFNPKWLRTNELCARTSAAAWPCFVWNCFGGCWFFNLSTSLLNVYPIVIMSNVRRKHSIRIWLPRNFHTRFILKRFTDYLSIK